MKLLWKYLLINVTGAVGVVIALNTVLALGWAVVCMIGMETMLIGAILHHIDSNRGHVPLDG